VNLLAGRRVVPELLQGDLTPERVAQEVESLWRPGEPRRAQLEGLAQVRGSLGAPGAARNAAAAARAVLER
jgi:lipid-A-disaccharide synthase